MAKIRKSKKSVVVGVVPDVAVPDELVGDLAVCSHCGCVLGDDKECAYGAEYCPACFEELFFVCTCCDGVFSRADNDCQTHDEQDYCSDCYNDTFFTCSHCGDVLPINDEIVSDIDGCGYCEDCWRELYFNCYNCGREFHQRFRNYSEITGEDYCSECFNDRFTHCEGCGAERRIDDCCEECDYDEDCEDEDGYCSCGIHNHSYRPYANFHCLPSEHKTDLYFGIECEIEDEYGGGKDFPSSLDEDFLYCKHDSSIDKGFEVVSHPMSFDYIQANANDIWGSMFDLTKVGCKSYKTHTCGIHIHLSSKAFGTWHLYKFLKFFQDNQEFILIVSQRRAELLNRWATLNNDGKSIAYKIKYKGDSSRYVAVNLQNKKTIEVRIFRGTLYKPSFLKNIEFCKALFDFSRDEKPSNMLQANFIKYVVENQKKFYNLCNFLRGKNLCV